MTITNLYSNLIVCISTHILTKRMTSYICMKHMHITFQLTSSRRGWHSSIYWHSNFLLFQLTSSRRGWQSLHLSIRTFLYFNSHPHEEDDIICLIIELQTIVFQLTSSRRGWLAGYVIHDNSLIISTHILTKRMTDQMKQYRREILFQLTSSRRGWLKLPLPNLYHGYFNSHPHEEDD